MASYLDSKFLTSYKLIAVNRIVYYFNRLPPIWRRSKLGNLMRMEAAYFQNDLRLWPLAWHSYEARDI